MYITRKEHVPFLLARS